MKAFMTLVMVLFLAGCAAGEGNAGRTQAAKTTANGMEETTVYKEETTVLAIVEPPDSTLSYGGREVNGALGTYCWFSGGSGACVDSIGPTIASERKTLTVPPNSEMVFRYGGQNPPKTVEAGAYALNKLKKARGVVRPDRSLKVQRSGVQGTIPANMPPGGYVLEVFVEVQQGDASYYFRIVVE
jgi:hypothetical protein